MPLHRCPVRRRCIAFWTEWNRFDFLTLSICFFVSLLLGFCAVCFVCGIQSGYLFHPHLWNVLCNQDSLSCSPCHIILNLKSYRGEEVYLASWWYHTWCSRRAWGTSRFFVKFATLVWLKYARSEGIYLYVLLLVFLGGKHLPIECDQKSSERRVLGSNSSHALFWILLCFH